MNPTSPGNPQKTDGQRGVGAKTDDVPDALEVAQQESVRERAPATPQCPHPVRVTVGVVRPSGSKSTYEVVTRNLSAGGLSFLQGGYLKVGTECTVQLTTADNARKTATATVVGCRHVGGRVHEVSARFTKPLEANDFISERLSGTILLVDDAAGFAALTSHHLTKGGLRVLIADRGSKALKLVKEQHFDLILMDLDMPGLDGVTVNRQMRDQGVDVPIIALSAATSPDARKQWLEAGADGFLAKPVDRAKLVNVIREHLGDQEPLASEVRQLKAIAGGSGGCGFDEISQAAAKVEEALSKGPDWEAAATRLKNVRGLCRRARASRRAEQSGSARAGGTVALSISPD